jgi:hypothetical protein
MNKGIKKKPIKKHKTQVSKPTLNAHNTINALM